MSAVALVIQLEVGTSTGDSAVQRIVTAMERAGENLTDFGQHTFPLLAPVFEAAESRQFDSRGGGPTAGHWAELTTKYAEWKAKHFPGKAILERTGDLREALTSSSSPLASREYSASEFAFGTVGLEYASFHQVGTRSMVARPPFDFDSTFESELEQQMQLGIVAAVRAAGVADFAEVST